MTKYDLLDNKGTAITHTEEIQADGSTNITAFNLTPNTTYSGWSVQEAGNSATKSVVSDFKTDDVLPGVPGLVITAGKTSVNYTITAPASNGGSPVIDYKIYYSDGNNSQTFDAKLTLTGTITGLTGGLPYNFQVAALNGAGETDKSAVSAVTPTA